MAVVQARERLTRRWQEENEAAGRKGNEGRTLLSAKEIREALNARSVRGEEEAEKVMRLRRGVLGQRGMGEGVVANT
jgi:hypothetical protein